MTWIILVIFCPLPGAGDGSCRRAPVQPEPYHYFARERCEREKSALRYVDTIPEGYEIVVFCDDSEIWP